MSIWQIVDCNIVSDANVHTLAKSLLLSDMSPGPHLQLYLDPSSGCSTNRDQRTVIAPVERMSQETSADIWHSVDRTV